MVSEDGTRRQKNCRQIVFWVNPVPKSRGGIFFIFCLHPNIDIEMPFQNIDIIIDIVRNMHIDIGIDIDIGKIGPIFFKFSSDFYRGYLAFTEQILSDCLDSVAKTLIFLYNYCPLGENFMLNELFDDRKTLVLTKELIFIIMAQ